MRGIAPASQDAFVPLYWQRLRALGTASPRGRRVRQRIELIATVEQNDVGFRSLQKAIETTSPGGMLIFQIFGVLAEFERNLIRERTMARLSVAGTAGRTGGRPKKLSARQRGSVRELYGQKRMTLADVCNAFGISKLTL